MHISEIRFHGITIRIRDIRNSILDIVKRIRRYTRQQVVGVHSLYTQLYSPSKAATIKNKQNKEKEAK